MALVTGGPFLAGATGEQVGLSDWEPDIPRRPRSRQVLEVAGFCIDELEASAEGGLPVNRVGWEELDAACAARGARQCTEDEWTKACGGVLGWLFPYGNTHVPGLCRDDVAEQGDYDLRLPGGSRPGCVSPYGVLDLDGNVSEYVSTPVPGRPEFRWVLGGTLWLGTYGRGCQARHAHGPHTLMGDDGYRCCAEAR